MRHIITVQHTQSLQHVNGRIGSWTDWPLTQLGCRQAEAIAAGLARLFIQESWNAEEWLLVASDLLRARQTAQPIAAALGLELHTDPALREIGLGQAVGKSREWAAAHSAEAGEVDWTRDVELALYPGAETRRQLYGRVAAFCEKLLAETDRNLILVGHDGSLASLRAHWLGVPVQQMEQHGITGRSGGVCRLCCAPDGSRSVLCTNDISYIQGL